MTMCLFACIVYSLEELVGTSIAEQISFNRVSMPQPLKGHYKLIFPHCKLEALMFLKLVLFNVTLSKISNM